VCVGVCVCVRVLSRSSAEAMASLIVFCYQLDNPALPQVTIGVVGKYTGLADSYLSISKVPSSGHVLMCDYSGLCPRFPCN